MTDLVPPFPPEVPETPRDYVVRIARHYGANGLADDLDALPMDDEHVRRLNALPPFGPNTRRQFPSAEALRLLCEFPDTSADALLPTLLDLEREVAVDAETAELATGPDGTSPPRVAD
jgi:hypothetical protein